ncbi:MAG: hypothetical protein KDD52_04865 [Bdellovibrionales bacterium]|nr:hypothetical protein [Bdellovibrionales bacterium]
MKVFDLQRLFSFFALGAMFLFPLSCGKGNTIELRVELASNQNSNPLIALQSSFDQGLSRGIYFVFDPLKDNPVSINDVLLDQSISVPSLSSAAGSSPTSDQYDIDTSLFSSGTFYRVQMRALDSGGNTTHLGVSDCPINLAAGSDNTVTICFGVNQPTVCSGTRPFACCPGLATASCTE